MSARSGCNTQSWGVPGPARNESQVSQVKSARVRSFHSPSLSSKLPGRRIRRSARFFESRVALPSAHRAPLLIEHIQRASHPSAMLRLPARRLSTISSPGPSRKASAPARPPAGQQQQPSLPQSLLKHASTRLSKQAKAVTQSRRRGAVTRAEEKREEERGGYSIDID